jgi:hypothetical protein
MSCPICNKSKADEKRYQPFCSKRCADVDLHRWLGGGYAIAGEPADDEALAAAMRDGDGAKR